MKKLILVLSLCASFVWAQESGGADVAKEWLNIIDAGQYAESWQKSDNFFKEKLSQEQWSDALSGIRQPLGDVISRVELGQKSYTSLPGAPEGEYLVIQYKTEFQNKESAIETLTLSKSSDDWLPVGYFIK